MAMPEPDRPGAPVERQTVVLLGPKRGGKSAILATMRDCIALDGHGYRRDAALRLDALTKDEYQVFRASGDLPLIFGASSGNYAAEEEKFTQLESQEHFATQVDATWEYFFNLDMASERSDRPTSYRFRVVDAGGEVALPLPGETVSDDTKQQLSDAIMEADALILVVPLIEQETQRWVSRLSGLVAQLASRRLRLKRLVIVGSQYEHLFIRFGVDAFRVAAEPQMVRYVIGKMLAKAPWRWDIEYLENAMPKLEVGITVTSAFGFARGYGNPNVDPHMDRLRPQLERVRFRTEGRAGAAMPFWRPFLTADPFIYAVTGRPSAYVVSLREFAGRARPQPDAPPRQAPPPPPKPSGPSPIGKAVRSLTSWLNANR
jgi:hypothetical protein